MKGKTICLEKGEVRRDQLKKYDYDFLQIDQVLSDLRKSRTTAIVRLFQARKKAEERKALLLNVARTGIEPATQGFSVLCSTD